MYPFPRKPRRPAALLWPALWAALLLGSPAAGAQTPYKVGYVDIDKVLEQAPQADSARTRLEKEFAPRDNELVALQQEIRDLTERVERDGAVVSEDERLRLERELRSMRRDLKRRQDEFREDLNLRRNQELAKLQEVVLETIQSLARQESFDLIVRDALFHSGRVDITLRVVERLQRDYQESIK